MAISYIAIPGTYAAKRQQDWDAPDSEFNKFLAAHGIEPLVTDPFKRYAWSTALDGINGTDETWDAGGRALMHYLVPPLGWGPAIPPEKVYIISHSHGGNVVMYACGKYGLKVEALVTVGMPVRGDLEALYAKAAPRIKRHLHIHAGWGDWWQVFGSMFDGRFGIHRKHPFARNEKVTGSHGDMLRNPEMFKLWLENGRLDFFKGVL